MLRLSTIEVCLIAFLSLALLTGIGIAIYSKSNKAVAVNLDRFDLDSMVECAQDGLERKAAGRISINEAGVQDLVKLKGVGTILANRIIDYRSIHGCFFYPEDIKNVKGIGRTLYDRIKDEIIIE